MAKPLQSDSQTLRENARKMTAKQLQNDGQMLHENDRKMTTKRSVKTTANDGQTLR